MQHLRIQPPQFDGNVGFPLDLMPDMTTSATASESDNMMDHDMDFDMDETLQTPAYAAPETQYCYAESGSGGFGFGPGAEEDEMESDDGSPKTGYAELGMYPTGVAHPNPHHFTTTLPPYGNQSAPASANPWNASGTATGLIQPSSGMALGPDASAVDRARNAHGPHCKSIPQLRMSDYPDANGARSMWSLCPDCGTCERAS